MRQICAGQVQRGRANRRPDGEKSKVLEAETVSEKVAPDPLDFGEVAARTRSWNFGSEK